MVPGIWPRYEELARIEMKMFEGTYRRQEDWRMKQQVQRSFTKGFREEVIIF